MRVCLMIFAALWLAFAPAPLFAEEAENGTEQQEQEAVDCQAALFSAYAGYFEIWRGMANYKAAIDSGYEGCKIFYPEHFEDTEPFAGHWQENAQAEMDRAGEVLDSLLAAPDHEDVPASCREDEKARQAVRETMRAAVEQQYERAHRRRYEIITAAIPEESETVLDFETNDSCRWVREAMARYYDAENRGRLERNFFRHVLLNMVKDQRSPTGNRRSDRRLFREFERLRDAQE